LPRIDWTQIDHSSREKVHLGPVDSFLVTAAGTSHRQHRALRPNGLHEQWITRERWLPPGKLLQ
ncbi:hypothetical protein, partial [Leucobacter sp. OLTLW20]|uniref:hypothetical protein n=1 Tax=Leucobacter sp. OLTLW20 TaxID=1914916 RepID=UPI001A7E0E99